MTIRELLAPGRALPPPDISVADVVKFYCSLKYFVTPDEIMAMEAERLARP